MTDVILDPGPLPVGPYDKRGPVRWGVYCLIASEAALFAYLLFSYYYLDTQLPRSWLPAEPPKFVLSAPNTVILLLSSVAVWWGESGIKRGQVRRCMIGFLIALVLGAVFIAIQLLEWKAKHEGLPDGPYGSIYYTVTGFHMAHVAAGLIALVMVLIWSALGYFDAVRHAAVANAALYWHFVDAVWLTVFFTFYVTPFLW